MSSTLPLVGVTVTVSVDTEYFIIWVSSRINGPPTISQFAQKNNCKSLYIWSNKFANLIFKFRMVFNLLFSAIVCPQSLLLSSGIQHLSVLGHTWISVFLSYILNSLFLIFLISISLFSNSYDHNVREIYHNYS